jgi:hypothetical protein
VVERNKKCGCIDRQGREVVRPVWDVVCDFDAHGLARVKRDKQWGWIDRQGREVIPCVWDRALSFDSHGWAQVERFRRGAVIDRKGRVALECGSWWEPFEPPLHENALGYQCTEYRHPLLHKIPFAAKLASTLGLDKTAALHDLTFQYDFELNTIWRSDLYALRGLLLPAAAFFGVLAFLCGLWLQSTN